MRVAVKDSRSETATLRLVNILSEGALRRGPVLAQPEDESKGPEKEM